MKTIIIAGNVGKDAILRKTQGGDSVLGFSVAVEERAGGEKRTVWFDVSLWGKRGEALEQYVTKGSRIAVSGELGTREHEGRTYLTVRADNLTLLGGAARDGDRDERPDPARQAPQGRGPDFDDEIPF